MVAEQVLQFTECLERRTGTCRHRSNWCTTDPIDLPRGAAGSNRMATTEQTTPQSTTPVTRLIDTESLLQVTPYHGDKESFLGWKRSFLIAVREISKPLDEDNMNQDFRKYRLSIGDLELADQAYTLLALLCKK